LKVPVHANVTIKNHEGVMTFGAVDWVEGQILQLKADGYLPQGTSCELRMDLTGTSETVYAEAHVVSVDSTSVEPSAVVRLRRMGASDREKLRDWVEERSQTSQLSGPRDNRRTRDSQRTRNPQRAHSTQSNPGRHLDSVSNSVLRDRRDDSSTVIGRRSGRESIRAALRRSVAERKQAQTVAPPVPSPSAAPPADPHIEIDSESRVTVTWSTNEKLLDDINTQLRKGRLALPFTPGSPRFLLRMVLPDSQIFALPATAQPADRGCVAHFRIGLPLKQKLRRAAAS